MLPQIQSEVSLPPGVTLRSGATEDLPTVRELVLAAYHQYQPLMAPTAWSRYLADLLDLNRHSCLGRLVVAETDGQIVGPAAYYPDAGVQGLGWPAGWAGGRGLAVHPGARGRGVAHSLLAEFERLAREDGAPVFAFHTAAFMTLAVSLYERLGYVRAHVYDRDLNDYLGTAGGPALPMLAYRRDLFGATS